MRALRLSRITTIRYSRMWPAVRRMRKRQRLALRGEVLFKLPSDAQLLVTGRYAREDVHAGSWEERATYNVGPGVDAYLPANVNQYGACPGCNASGVPNSGPFTIRDNLSGLRRSRPQASARSTPRTSRE